VSTPDPPARESAARLRRAAVAAFAERGFHGTTTRHIASGAEMSPAAVYIHHRSKEELLYDISVQGHDEVLALVRDAVASADHPTGQLSALMAAFTAFHATNHTIARIINDELAALTPPHLEQVLIRRRTIDEAMRDVVERGASSGEFRVDDASITALALLSMGMDVARWFRDDGRWSVEQVASHYGRLALRLVGAREEAGA
jgi:AcrR family transcriptional regulator